MPTALTPRAAALAWTLLFAGVAAAVAAAPSPRPPRRVDLVVWEHDERMPPAQIGREPSGHVEYEKVLLRVVHYTRGAQTELTQIVQWAQTYEGRRESVVHQVPAEQLSSADVRDMNGDGIREVLLRFAPVGRLSWTRLVVLGYSRLDHHWRVVWQAEPGPDVKTRWIALPRDGLIRPVALEVSAPAAPGPIGVPTPGLRTVSLWRYRAERFLEVR